MFHLGTKKLGRRWIWSHNAFHSLGTLRALLDTVTPNRLLWNEDEIDQRICVHLLGAVNCCRWSSVCMHQHGDIDTQTRGCVEIQRSICKAYVQGILSGIWWDPKIGFELLCFTILVSWRSSFNKQGVQMRSIIGCFYSLERRAESASISNYDYKTD